MNNIKPDFAVAESASIEDLLVGCASNGRADWISCQFQEGELILFQDGLLLKQIAKEAIHCFVEGQFIATVLLAFSLIERSIAGRLLVIGETKVRNGRPLKELLNQACDKNWISQKELQEISKTCAQYRNSLAHIRTPTESERHEVRARNKGCELREVIEDDARLVLCVALKILRKTSL